MNKLFFISLALPILSSAQTIKRIGSINLAGSGLIKIEAEVLSETSGSNLKRSIYTEDISEYDYALNKILCGNQLSAESNMILTVKLTDESGKIITKTAPAQIERSFESNVETKSECTNKIPSQGQTSVSLTSKFLDFIVTNAKGQKSKIKLSTYLTGEMNHNKQNFKLAINEKSFTQMRIYTDSGSSSTQLSDPDENLDSSDPYCSAHPYDCKP